MTEQVTNFGITTVNEELDASETVITVADGTVFPAEGNFRVNVDDELMLVTSRSGNDLTVVRGSEGTTATTHSITSTIKQVLTGEGLLTIVKENYPVAGSISGARVYNNGTQSVAHDTWTAITFDSEDWDTDSFHSTTTNTSRFTIPAGMGGKYRFRGTIPFGHTHASAGIATVSINGTNVDVTDDRVNLGSNNTYESPTIDVILDLNGGDYVELEAYQNSGSSQNVGHASARGVQCEMEIYRLAPAPTTADAIGAKVYRSSAQSISAATTDFASFDTVLKDTDGFWSSGNPTRLTIPPGLAGTYWIHFGARSSVAQQHETWFRINRGEADQSDVYGADFWMSGQTCFSNTMVELNAGDFIECGVYGSSAFSLGHASADEAQATVDLVLLHTTGNPTRAGNQRLLQDSYMGNSNTSLTLNSTTWADLPTVKDFVVQANAGDILNLKLMGLWGAESVVAGIDAATRVGGSDVNYFSLQTPDTTTFGFYYAPSTALNLPLAGTIDYIVQPGDIENGNVTVRLKYRTFTASNKTIYHHEDYPLLISLTNMKAGGDGQAALGAHQQSYTGGDITLNSTSWADVSGPGDLVVAASVGDVLAVSLSARIDNQAVWSYFDFDTRVGGSSVNSISGGTNGAQAWVGVTSANTSVGSTVLYTVQSGDIENGNVTLRLRYKTSSATNKNLKASTDNPLTFSAINLKAAGDIKAFGTAGRGHTFPTNPAIGEEFHRSDLEQDYFWDGTRWKTKQEYVLTYSEVGTTSADSYAGAMIALPMQTFQLVRWEVMGRAVSAAGESWDVYLRYLDSGDSYIDIDSQTIVFPTGSYPATKTASLGDVFDNSTGEYALRLYYDEISGAIAPLFAANIYYRLVAT